jgi:RNA polymerase sigma factor (sigma-70 family)
MTQDHSFEDLMGRVQLGEPQAWDELVRGYGKMIQMMIRCRLTNRQHRRLLDSMDLLQSVFANFYVGVAAGQFKLKTEEDLKKLLMKITSNKITSWARKQQAARRNPQRLQCDDPNQAEGIDSAPSPSQVVANKELVQEIRRRMSAAEQQLMELRLANFSWEEIAGKSGSTPDQARMQYNRAIERVKRELGIE